MENESEVPESSQKKKKKRTFGRFLFRLFIFFIIVILLLITTGAIIGMYYKNEVKEYVISELNKHLNSEIIVDGKDIDFTVISSFPNASINFKNIKALDAISKAKKDTLFKANEIALQFNILDIFHKKYSIKKLIIDNADLKIKIFKDGKDNYHFWKTSTDTTSSNLAFNLEDIELHSINFSYKDARTKQNYDGTIRKSKLSGNFSEQKYSLESTSDLTINYIKNDSITFVKNKNIHAAVDLKVDNGMQSYKINKAKLKVEDINFEVYGSVLIANNAPLLNLGFKGKDMDIKSVLSLIPAKYKGHINDYESDGEFYLNATVNGSFTNNQTPEVTADFGTKNAEITQVKDNITFHKVNLKGHYTNGNKANKEASSLTLKNVSALFNDKTIEGNLSLINLNNPSFDGKIKADISLEELQRFMKIDTIENITGEMKIDASFSGEGKSVSSGKYLNISTSGTLMISDMNLKLKNAESPVTKVNGDFNFDNNDLEINNLTGNIAKSDFDLKGYFRNAINYLFKDNQDITIEATLNSKNINLNEILSNKGSSGASSKYKLQFSDHINVNLNSEIAHLSFRQFDATNIKGQIRIKDNKLFADPITLNTMDGSITTSGMADGTDSTKLLVTCYSEMEKINITKLFYEFENFGESAITDKNLKGIATAKVNFAAELSPELKINLDKLYAAVDMSLDNGELNNVESLKKLSRYIELSELEHIKFATLKNQIEIKNQVVNIPKMEVKSSAINIIASGTHKFNNDINYKIKLSLNELLAKKAKKAKKENDEFGEVADDGLGRTNIFLLMTGNLDNPVIKYDSKSAVQNVKQDLKVEKQTLKTILKDEFGLFKKDSTLNKKAPKEETKFNIKWDEADKKEDAPDPKTGKKQLKKPKKEESEDFE